MKPLLTARQNTSPFPTLSSAGIFQAFAILMRRTRQVCAYSKIVPFLSARIKSNKSEQSVADADVVQGHIALVGAGPGARDLLTLRAVQRLQEADAIFYDRLVDPDILQLAKPDAERIFVGKEVGACAWPQARICAVIVAEACKGRRVVRLKSGDPSIFGRATEEIVAAKSAGIPVEIVPGITAATAAAASMGRSLTERGDTDTLVLTTGACRDGDCDPAWADHVQPGTTLVFYMGVRAAHDIACTLIGRGALSNTRVDLACDVATDSERHFETTLSELGASMKAHGIKGKALIFIRFSKRATMPNLKVA